jgi:hypothetical protein
MTYSNTKKDNIQVSYREKLKNIVIVVGLTIFIASGWINIVGQLQTLIEAERINDDLAEKTANLEYEAKVEEAKLKEATTEADQQRRARNLLGLGKPGDKWIVLPKLEDNINIGQEYMIDEEVPNIIRWWRLFTK